MGTTAADGVYSIGGLAAGVYLLKESAPSGYYPAHPADQFAVGVVVGQQTMVDFAHLPLPTATPTPTFTPTFTPTPTRTSTPVPFRVFLPLERK